MSIKLKRWDFLDKKTNERYAKLRGGVLPFEKRNYLSTLITRPAMLIQQLHACLYDNPKLDVDQKKLIKYMLFYVNNKNVYGTDAVNKRKPCYMGYVMYSCRALTSFPIETLTSMEMLAEEDNLLSYVYSKEDNNQTEYKIALSSESTERMNMRNSILIRPDQDLEKIIHFLNPGFSSLHQGRVKSVASARVITRIDLMTTELHDWTGDHFLAVKKLIGFLSDKKMEYIVENVLDDFDHKLNKEHHLEFLRLALIVKQGLEPVSVTAEQKDSVSIKTEAEGDEIKESTDESEETDFKESTDESEDADLDEASIRAANMENCKYMQAVRSIQEHYQETWDFLLTPSQASVYSGEDARSWDEVSHEDFMLLLHVLRCKTQEVEPLAWRVTDKFADAETSDAGAKLQGKVQEKYTASQEKMNEFGWSNICGAMASGMYEKKINYGSILEDNPTAVTAMTRAYYKRHKEALEIEVNNFEREVSSIGFKEGMYAILHAIAMDQILLEELNAILELVAKQNQLAVDKYIEALTHSAKDYLDMVSPHPVSVYSGCMMIMEFALPALMSLENTDLQSEVRRKEIEKLHNEGNLLVERVYHRQDTSSYVYTFNTGSLVAAEAWMETAAKLGTEVSSIDALAVLTGTHPYRGILCIRK